jgi:hypothetical protein
VHSAALRRWSKREESSWESGLGFLLGLYISSQYQAHMGFFSRQTGTSTILLGGQPYGTASINVALTEVVSLHCPPRLSINQGGCWPSCPASNN